MLTLMHRALEGAMRLERRVDPFIRPPFDRLRHGPLTRLVQAWINLSRPREDLALAEERVGADEESLIQAIIERMKAHLAQDFQPGGFERGGQTKTYGLATATVTVLPDLPEPLRQGLFAEPASYPAWIRFSNPGPHLERDIDDVGVGSIGIKLMGVAGEKLIEEEQGTQDFTGLTTPFFVSRNLKANVALQYWSKRHLGLYYFLDPRASHVRELIMQGLWSQTLNNPLGHAYYSCVPYAHGEGRAVHYAFLPQSRVPMRIPRLPLRPPDDYLRLAMVRTLAAQDVEFVMTAQVQTDPFRMPIEDSAVIWPEQLSPRVPIARIHIPVQAVDDPRRAALDRRMRINPGHSLAAHRPLGAQNRARLRIYHEMAVYRQAMNDEPHVEPTPDDPVFNA